MKVSVVIRKSWDAWVLRKIGLKLVENLVELGIEADYVTAPNPESDINHFMHFSFAETVPGSISTTMITHVDDAIKARRLKEILSQQVNGGICMSRYHMEELIDYGISPEKLSYVLPALDNTQVRKIHFTLHGNRYRDGRKNEEFLKRLARSIDLSFAEFSFFGTGWEEIVEILTKAGVDVTVQLPTEDFTEDYVRMNKALELADYYVNMGWDEGSLGSLDAFVNRTSMIISAQGYHLNVFDKNTRYFSNYEEFHSIFQSISAEQAHKQEIAKNMSWQQYAKCHQGIWDSLLKSGILPLPQVSNYGDGVQQFDRIHLKPILDTSHRKTISRAKVIALRKLGIKNG
jgi:hypothetical protein